MKAPHYSFLLTIMVFLYGIQAYTQDLQFKSFTTKNGLSTYNAHNILQDRFGFIWIATQDGINRFDGFNFINITQNNATGSSLGGSSVTDCKLDANGLIWVATDYGGIDVIDPATLRIVNRLTADKSKKNGLLSNWVRYLEWQNDSTLWVGTYYGISVYNSHIKTFTSITENVFKSSTPLNVSYVGKNMNGDIFAGIENGGIIIYNSKKEIAGIVTKKMLGIGDKEPFSLNSIYPDSAGKIYLCTNFGIRCLLQKNGKYSLSEPDKIVQRFRNIETHHINRDREGTYWMATTSGLYLLNTSLDTERLYTHEYTEPNSILDNYVNNIFQDSFSNTWISSSKGVNLVSNAEYVFKSVSYNSTQKQSLNHLYSLTPQSDSTLFASTSAGLYLYNLHQNQFTRVFDQKNYGLVDAIYKIASNTYIVSAEKKTFLLHINGQQFTMSGISSIDKQLAVLENKYLSKIVPVADSLLLFGTMDESGLFVWNKNLHTLVNYTMAIDSDTALLDNYVQNIKIDRDGKVWVISDMVLTHFDYVQKKFHHILPKPNTPGRLNSFFMMDMYDDGNNYYISSYGGGVNVLNKKTGAATALTDKQGLSANTTYSIIAENDSLLWVSSNNGLSRINILNNAITQFKYEDGLQSNSFEVTSACKIADAIVFGGIDGFSIIRRNQHFLQVSRFPVYFSNISYQSKAGPGNNHELFPAQPIQIPSEPDQLSFSVSGIGYARTKNYTSEYRIRELTNTWIPLKEDNRLILSGIPTGLYHIEARVSNIPGIWNYSAVCSVEILPRWYQTSLFKFALVIAALSIGFAIFKIRVNQIKHEEQIRIRLAGDLHDDLGSTMYSIKVYANLALLHRGREDYLHKIKDATQEAIISIRDLIWVLDDKMNNIEALFDRVSGFGTSICAANDISFSLEISEDARYLSLSVAEKRNLYMILKESINNAVKYAHAKQVSIRAYATGMKPEIRISDDGHGFDLSYASKGNGIKNMYRRGKEIRFNVHIISRPENGTEIWLKKI